MEIQIICSVIYIFDSGAIAACGRRNQGRPERISRPVFLQQKGDYRI